MKLLLPFLIVFPLFSLAQKHTDHGELPDFIYNDFDIHYVSDGMINVMSSQMQLKKIVRGEITIQTTIEAFADTEFELGAKEYLLFSEIVSCPDNRRRDYKFTLYDPIIQKQWSFYIQEHEELRALYKYRKLVQDKVGVFDNRPKVRTGSDEINPKVQILLKEEERDFADKKLYVYYSKDEFENDSSTFIGEYIEYSNVKSLLYLDTNGKETKVDPNEIYGFKLNKITFFVLEDHHVIVTPLGYREKYFYLNATTTLNIIATSKEAFKLGFGSDPTRIHFVSDTENGKIYKLHDLKNDYSGELNSIFDCVDELKSTESQSLIFKELSCVQEFLSEEE